MPTPRARTESAIYEKAESPMQGRGHAMTRAELQEAIADLEYLIRHRFDPDKVEEYAQQLQEFREELRVLEEKEIVAVFAPIRVLVHGTARRFTRK